METIEKIKNWAVKGEALTPKDKAEIKRLCTEAALPVTFKSKCPNCYRDAVAVLYRHYSVGVPAASVDRAIAKPCVVFTAHYGAIKINANTTEAQWQQIKVDAPEIYNKYRHED